MADPLEELPHSFQAHNPDPLKIHVDVRQDRAVTEDNAHDKRMGKGPVQFQIQVRSYAVQLPQ